ncbi:MAG: hypothetical protein DSY47_03650 [Hydrogenothermus sp.]|nr:MAG: hypothetical protein DSY47_03650 [Hydrogenothermus sp.]
MESLFKELLSLQEDLNKLVKKIYDIALEQNLEVSIYILNTFSDIFEKFKLEDSYLKKEIADFDKDFLNELSQKGSLELDNKYFFAVYGDGNLLSILQIEGEMTNFPLDFILEVLKISVKYYFLHTHLKKEKLIIDNISEAVAVIDNKYIIKEVNSSFLELLGYRYSVKDLINKNILDFLDYLSEELTYKLEKVKEQLLPEELVSELIKLKIIPLTDEELGEKKLLNIALIFKYPKG